MTVLFADVVRSMDIAAALDVERYREIMTEVGGAVGGGSATLRRERGIHRRWGNGAVRRPSGVGGSRFSGMPGRDGHPGGGQPAGGRGGAPRWRGAAVAGWPELGSGDRRGQSVLDRLGYAATGDTVGLAQRMESVAPPGGVLLSESTARLVDTP